MVSAFTQGPIKNNLYIFQPEGYIDPESKDSIYKLNKALYSLKQSARIWLDTLKEVLIYELKFKSLLSENTIFYNKELNIIICLYVDDLAIIGPNKETITSFIKTLKGYFDLKDLGLIKDYLGVEIDYNPKDRSIKLYQTKYINKMLKRFNMEDSNPCYTPMDNKIKLEPNKLEANIEEIKWYQAAIGSLLFLMLATRLDLAYSIIKLARYASNPSPIHANAVKRVFRYLKGSIDLGIHIK